ncbi:hypothetical protein ACQPZG_00190 (plasmid) [Streptomyces sp. CA-294286]|uniref:hypothetical protein n=1 Tax=Streptomyces sp. CA-294286 TaxID=3240070 RepID=UPI003D944132
MSQLWQSRLQGQAPPSTTGWKVQNPPSTAWSHKVTVRKQWLDKWTDDTGTVDLPPTHRNSPK